MLGPFDRYAGVARRSDASTQQAPTLPPRASRDRVTAGSDPKDTNVVAIGVKLASEDFDSDPQGIIYEPPVVQTALAHAAPYTNPNRPPASKPAIIRNDEGELYEAPKPNGPMATIKLYDVPHDAVRGAGDNQPLYEPPVAGGAASQPLYEAPLAGSAASQPLYEAPPAGGAAASQPLYTANTGVHESPAMYEALSGVTRVPHAQTLYVPLSETGYPKKNRHYNDDDDDLGLYEPTANDQRSHGTGYGGVGQEPLYETIPGETVTPTHSRYVVSHECAFLYQRSTSTIR